MFDNIGRKIQTAAKIIVWIGIAFSVLFSFQIIKIATAMNDIDSLFSLFNSGIGFWISMLAYSGVIENIDTFLWIAAFISLIGGCLISWLMSSLLYGLGRLIENSDIISGRINNMDFAEKDNSYKADLFYNYSANDNRTFEQIVVNSNLSDQQKQQILHMKKLLDDDLIDVTNFCSNIRHIASDQPVEFVNKLMRKL